MSIGFISGLSNFLGFSSIAPEALLAYFQRIPETISVRWERDGGMIVGHVKVDDKEFVTQGENPDDFIKMVNDSVYAVYDIPFNYVDALSKQKAFKPKEEEMLKLYNGSIPTSSLSIQKKRNLAVA